MYNNIKSNYILEKIFKLYLDEKVYLQIVKKNKHIKKR